MTIIEPGATQHRGPGDSDSLAGRLETWDLCFRALGGHFVVLGLHLLACIGQPATGLWQQQARCAEQ